MEFLSGDEQSFAFFFTDGQDHDRLFRGVDFVKDAKTILRTTAQLPLGSEGCRLTERFAVASLGGWCVYQLFVNGLFDQSMTLAFDGHEMLNRLRREDQLKFGRPWHGPE